MARRIPRWHYPARTFERQTGFTGLSANWSLPFIVDSRDDTSRWNDLDVTELWQIVVRHNPQLSKLEPISDDHVIESSRSGGIIRPGYRDILLGVMSQFTIEDIRAYINPKRVPSMDSCKNTYVEQLTGYWPGWVISDLTYDKILGQIYSGTRRINHKRPNPQDIPIRTPEGSKIRSAAIKGVYYE